jgi:polyisoprenoid-binding protein YceI
MFRIRLIFSLLLCSFAVAGQKYKPVDAGSKVHFIINNFGIATGGDLSGISGDITFLPANTAASSFNVSVDVATIDTDNASRDESLRSSDYFDAEKYPVITIKSTKVNRTNKSSSGWYHFTGTLTIRDVTKPIAFPFRVTKKGNDYLFVGGFTINRLDYGVGKRSATISNNLKVSISVLAKKS